MKHLDDARREAEEAIAAFLGSKEASKSWRVLLVVDVFARLRVVLWCPDPKKNWKAASDELAEKLAAVAGPFWSKTVLEGSKKNELPDGPWQDEAWEEARVVEGTADRLRVLERHRGKTGWFEAPPDPPWSLTKDAPAIVLFYSFKGGVGRSTALAATALNLAKAGDRVVVIDADLDAPGVGSLLAGQDGATASWGVVDYLLEQPVLREASNHDSMNSDLSDYYHRCPPSLISGPGEILVFPSGAFDGRRYLDKLARLDYGCPPDNGAHPFVALLCAIRDELAPQWILVDARAGLGDVSGFLTGGLCHLHVILGTLAESSWQGLELVLDRLGGDRVRRGESQAATVLVAAMVPRVQEADYARLVARFTDRAEGVFRERYYATPSEEVADRLWTLDDLESGDAPHVPVVLPYDQRLAVFRTLSEVSDTVLLAEEPYRRLAERVCSRLEESRRSST